MKKLLLTLIAFCSFLMLKAQNEFITEWQISGTTLQFPGIGSGYTLVWENVNNPASTGTITNAVSGQNITLPTSGTYRIKASNGSGVFIGFNANTYPANRDNLRYVRQWGNIQWASLKSAFYLCFYMDVTATDVPDLTNAKDLSNMFRGAYNLIGNSSFNNWNTQNVTNMSYMFFIASAFNQPIGNWNTQNVTNMSSMFSSASAFNQPIGNWNTQNVTNMYSMFNGANAFNQSLANWNLSSISSMNDMLIGSGMDCANYSATLNGWANATTTPNYRTLGADGMFYNSSAQAAHDKLVNEKGWTINGDFYFATCGAAAPVTFGNFSASIKDNNLFVKWNTITEINNKEFIIEVSKTGIDGWQKIATIQSKAENGNSSAGIDYAATIPLSTALAVTALSLLLIGFVPNKKYRFVAALAAIALIATMYACNKNMALEEEHATEKLFIRLSQVDKDGTTKVLGIKEAVRQ